MKKIKLRTRKDFASLQILVDDSDYWNCLQYNWHSTGYNHDSIMTRIDNKRIKITNFIMNDFENMYDHIDRNPFNNQRDNLRICNKQQNNFNKEKYITFTTSSQYKGVYWNKQIKKFVASIRINRKLIYLGSFINEQEAALAYDQKALELFGEFAYLNFPPFKKEVL